MHSNSRTAKSLKNSSIALAFYAINLILQFFSRKIFLDRLGSDILGLNTTASNMLQFLNLAESGIGAAVGFSLYAPLYRNDRQAINDILSLQGKLYRRIACIVMAAALALMAFFPLIFAKMQLPLWYAYASFGVLLFSALLGYFVNYKQVLLSADQKEYKIQYSYKAAMSAKLILQITAVKSFENGYLWWLVTEALFAVIGSFVLHRTVKNTYPFLKNTPRPLKELNAAYPATGTKIKQLFLHKIGNFALTQTSPLIIYAFLSLTAVAVYGNYMLVVTGLITLAGALSNGLTAGIGNLVAEGDIQKIMAVFEELFCVRFLIAAVIAFGFFILAQPFVTLWLGHDYLLPDSTLGILTAILFINVSRYSVESYLNAYGFYYDVWAPLTEAAINVGLSILLGHLFGLNGILCGVLISLLVIVLGWKPLFLFAINLKQGYRRYLAIYAKHMAITAATAFISYRLLKLFPADPSQSVRNLLLYSTAALGVFTLPLTAALWAAKCGIDRFFARLRRLKPSVKN